MESKFLILFLILPLTVLYGQDTNSSSASVSKEAIKVSVENLDVLNKHADKTEEEKGRQWLLYEDIFIGTTYAVRTQKTMVQQTTNWKFVQKDNDSDDGSYAKKLKYFVVKSEIPLEYTFSGTLLEHTKYRYTLCCRVKGKGKVTLSQKNGKIKKDFLINSTSFETVSCELGDGSSLHTPMTPSITMQGYLQIESIRLYQKAINDQWTVCVGTIEDISSVPDIKKSNYPDCYYTAKFVVKNILDGKPVPQNIQLLIPAFLDKKMDPLSKIMKKGDWEVSIRPYSLATPKEQEIEQVDEIETHFYSPYILNAATTCVFSQQANGVSGIPVLEGSTYTSPFDSPVNAPLEEKFINDSKEEIKEELEKVNKLIEQIDNAERINEEFQIVWDKKQKMYNSLDPNWIWAREENSFFALPKKWDFISDAQISDKNVDALVELDRFFKSQGIQFILQIVPDYRDIAALVLNPDFQKYGDQRSARVAKKLLERGIEVQYISDELVKNALKYERMFFYPTDYHPDEGAMDIMTTLMANRLKKYGDVLPKDLDSSLFSKENRDTGYGEYLKWPQNVDIGSHKAGTRVQVPHVLYNQKLMDPDPKSKVLVFGNSFTQEPMKRNAYISYLAPKIQYISACHAVGGEGAVNVLPRLFLTSPELYLRDKKVAILPLSITHLTDSSFANISLIDSTLKNLSKSKFILDFPLKQAEGAILPPHFVFNLRRYSDFVSSQNDCIVLSNVREQISFPVPDAVTANTARIALQPIRGCNVSVVINGKSYHLPSRFAPMWEILDFKLDKGEKEISVSIDLENCSSPEAQVFIGNISLFE